MVLSDVKLKTSALAIHRPLNHNIDNNTCLTKYTRVTQTILKEKRDLV